MDSVVMTSVACVVCAVCLGVLMVLVKGGKNLPSIVGDSMLKNVSVMTTNKAPWYVLDLVRSSGKKVFRMRIPAPLSVYVLCDSQCARIALEKGGDKPTGYSEFDSITGGHPSILTLQTRDPRWAHSRKWVAPAFSARRVDEGMKSEGCSKVLQDLFEILDRGSFVPSQLMSAASLDMLGSVACGGFDFGTVRGDGVGVSLMHALEKSLPEYAGRRMINPLRKHYSSFTESGRNAKAAADDIVKIAQVILDKFRETSPDDETSILGRIVSNPRYANDAARLADILIFLIAGLDTTANSLAFLLFELAENKEIAQKCRDDPDFFDNCVKESMRVWPVTALGPARILDEEIRLPDNLVIPKGSHIVVPFLPLFRSIDIPKPDEFIPERWNDPEQIDKLKAAFIPFALGNRNCVGQAVAKAELKLIAQAIINNYDLELVDPFTPDYFLTLKPKGGAIKATKIKECV